MSNRSIVTEELTDGTRIVRFNADVYRLLSVKKAAYRFGGHFYVLIEQSDNFVEARLKPKDSCKTPDSIVGEFCNEVLDQELREEIAVETAGIRDLLLAQAFSKTSLIDSGSETEDYEPSDAQPPTD
jgi:His-Xaa-Ser system protein HxsD